MLLSILGSISILPLKGSEALCLTWYVSFGCVRVEAEVQDVRTKWHLKFSCRLAGTVGPVCPALAMVILAAPKWKEQEPQDQTPLSSSAVRDFETGYWRLELSRNACAAESLCEKKVKVTADP